MQKEYQKPFYDVDWFLQFYKEKDPRLCITGKLVKQLSSGDLAYDVLGWLHRDKGDWDLFKRKLLFNLAPECISVWDGNNRRYQQVGPLERIVAYLEDIKKQKEASKLYWEKQRELNN